jgi:tRNA (guanine37-N1)-methyltransferase
MFNYSRSPLSQPLIRPSPPQTCALRPPPIPRIHCRVRLDVITLFPELVTVPMGTSIMRRAQEKQAIHLGVHDLRQFGLGKHRQVDDTPTGGGQGMLLRPEPLFAALESIATDASRIILTSPAGRRFDQATAQRLSSEQHLIFISGHYEGVDQRVIDHWVDEELSLGDYVLTNGAIAAVVMMDAIVRLLPGVLGDDMSAVEESFGPTGLLEAPHYTKPADFQGMAVPEILLSGNHAKITQWRAEQALERTRRMRPDLLAEGS